MTKPCPAVRPTTAWEIVDDRGDIYPRAVGGLRRDAWQFFVETLAPFDDEESGKARLMKDGWRIVKVDITERKP